MKMTAYTFLIMLVMMLVSCGEGETDEPKKATNSTAKVDSTTNTNTKDPQNSEEPQSIRLDDELSLEERFLAVIEKEDKAVVWVADDENQSVFEFKKDQRYKGWFKKGENKFEGDWKFEGKVFSLKIDGESDWNPVPISVVDRETLVMMNLEFKAEAQ